MFSLSRYTKSLLLVFLCTCAHIPTTQAGFFDFFKDKLFRALPNLYILSQTIETIDRIKMLTSAYAIKVDNAEIITKYPRACAYVQNELKKAGIDPTRIALTNEREIFKSRSLPRHLCIPLYPLESILEKQEKNEQIDNAIQQTFNQTKAVIAHEIGHLQHLSHLEGALAPLAAAISTWALTRNYHPRLIYGLIIKGMCVTSIKNLIDHIDEHMADSATIKRLKTEPSALVDCASFWLAQQRNERGYSSIPPNPIITTIWHWTEDVHGSHVARANRMLKAAGIPSNQWVLWHEIAKQFKERQKKEDIDMPRIIESCKKFAQKMDAIEIPEPLKTYGL